MKIFIFFIFFVLPFNIFSQENNLSLKHEIGINSLNLFNRHLTIESKLLYKKQNISKLNIINGVYYKYHLPNYSLNIFINIFHVKPFKDRYDTEILEINNKYIEYCFGLGMYKYFFKHKSFNVYIGCDIENNNCFLTREQGGGITGEMNKYKTEKYSFGLSPIIGLKYNVSNKVSLSFDASINGSYYFEKIFINENNDYYNLFTSHRFEYRFNSIKAINIGYHF